MTTKQLLNFQQRYFLIFLLPIFIIKSLTKMSKSRQAKKKVVQNFQFDPNQVKIIDGYEIFNAKNKFLNENFTLKRLNLNDPQNQTRHKLMLRQISILKELKGINIIKCHKILKSKSHLYLVFDYCSGKSLQDIIDKNQGFISLNKKIDSLTALKLQQDYVDMQMIQMIGKQLCQVLKQTSSLKIVHLAFVPSNMAILKHNLLKLTNFTHSRYLQSLQQGKIDQEIQKTQYTDPFLVQTENYGHYTDVFTFGKTLQNLYAIYKVSDKFKEVKSFEELIRKMTLTNPYQRVKLAQVYQYFFDHKIQTRLSRDTLKKSVAVNQKKSVVLNQNLRKDMAKKITSIEKKPRVFPQKTLTSCKSHNQLLSKPPIDLKTVQAQDLSVSKPLTYSRGISRRENSQNLLNQSKNYFNSPKSAQELLESFTNITKNVLKRRSISMLLLQLGEIVANKVNAQSNLAMQLSFLLYKKSLIEIVALAKYLSNGSIKYLPQISETSRLKFTKTEDYFVLFKIVNQQLQEQRSILISISSLIKKQCHSLASGSSSRGQIQEKRHSRSAHISQISDLQKEVTFEAFNNDFFVKTIHKYLQVFVSDLVIFNKNLPNTRQILYYLNVLLQILICGSYENFVQKYFLIEFDAQNKPVSRHSSYVSLLRMSPKLVGLQSMGVDELEKLLVQGLNTLK